MASFLLLQLVDGAFPSGGFAHSSGLEAAARFGGLTDTSVFLDQFLRQIGRGSLPFVRAACEDPSRLYEIDMHCDSTLLSHVANRASRAQGRALASAASRIFDVRLATANAPSHLSPIFGALFGRMGIDANEAQSAYLHSSARQVLSAAIRLGLVGPLEAQRIQSERAPLMDEIIASCTHLPLDDVAQTSPLIELYGALHDELDGRLFQS